MTSGVSRRLADARPVLGGAVLGASLLSIALLGAVPAAKAEDWASRWYDAKPADDDLLLPLPCGGKMAFRPIDVPAPPGPLDDRQVTLGSPDEGLGYAEYVRSTWLAAPFPTPAGGRRFYLGKYDVTRDQYSAMKGDCHSPSAAGLVAMSNVSFPEATAVGVDWSSWLLANARDVLPRRGAALAFARLPTDDEWEYAARGGTQVSGEDFLAPTWPMPEGIEHYAMAGSRLTGGRPQQVGLRLPNPLGLYDLLGNVAQMTLDPFRLNRVGRYHGGAGGITARGGNYNSQPETLHTAMRVEIPPFDPVTNQPTRLQSVGFRLALSAASVGDIHDAERFRAAFAEIKGQLHGGEPSTDPAHIVASLREQTGDPAVREKLDQLGAALASDERARADIGATALGAQLEAATALAQFVWRLEHDAKLFDAMVDIWPHPEEKQQMTEQAARRRSEENGSLDSYLRLLREVADGPARAGIEAQVGVLRQEMHGRGEAQLEAFLPVVATQALALRDGRAPDRSATRAAIIGVPTTHR